MLKAQQGPGGMSQLHGGAGLAVDVARILDEAGIPNVLWGWMAIALVGKDIGMREVDFVVPDEKVESATNVLAAAGFTVCMAPNCFELCEDRLPENHLDHWEGLPPEQRFMSWSHVNSVVAKDRRHPVAAAHFHVNTQYPSSEILAVHRKSYILWKFPPLTLDLPANDRNLMLSTDNRLTTRNGGTGPWIDLYPIKILTPCACAEALIYLRSRDYAHIKKLWRVWRSMLIVLSANDAEIRHQIQPSFRVVWESLNCRGPEEQNMWIPFNLLRDRLIAERELGELPPLDFEDVLQ
ncbi:hypothetical protein BDW59DRAFT_161154 [Aspergillus cavernicola]|uniref:Nucleotidyltransferase family protein n=1 Tax=Aspergillus cavernicola TaxID=176166 RepID=A0ABR4IEZ8_9EURO